LILGQNLNPMNLQTIKMNTKQKIIAIILIVSLICLVIVYFIIIPTTENIKKIKNEILTQKINFEKNLDQNKNITQITEQLKIIEPELKKFNNIFINQSQELEFITILEGIANQNKMVQKINLAPGQNKKNYQITKLNISLSGSFLNLINYLSDIEALDYYINIYSIDINKGQSTRTTEYAEYPDQKDANLNIKIIADTYWQQNYEQTTN